MRKIIAGVLSAALMMSAVSGAVYANSSAEMLLPNDMFSASITNNDSSDMYYVDFSAPINMDYNIYVETDNAYDVFVELSNDDGVLYSADNMNGEDVIAINAKNLTAGRYYVEVYGGVFDASTLNYTISCDSMASNPEVYSGTSIAMNSFKNTYSRESYWKFTLDKAEDVNFQFNPPANKEYTAVIYNENGVYDYDWGTDSSTLTASLDAGTYYIQVRVPSMGEEGMQIGISK